MKAFSFFLKALVDAAKSARIKKKTSKVLEKLKKILRFSSKLLSHFDDIKGPSKGKALVVGTAHVATSSEIDTLHFLEKEVQVFRQLMQKIAGKNSSI
ncbi:hypothetical protein Pfo_003477 [Paulownia fortunei]|nr:hypothetical protein Pfo_003477 [Paulownia fortunei]